MAAEASMNRTHLTTSFVLFALVVMGVAIIAPLRADDLPVVRVLAAGSLRATIGEIGSAFAGAANVRVESNFGPSGGLRERIEKGEQADLFASADMGNPLALSRAGKSGPVVLFARNRLCALVREGLAVTADTFLPNLLDPQVKL